MGVSTINRLLMLLLLFGLAACGKPASQSSAEPQGIGAVEVVVHTVHGTLEQQPMPRLLAVRDDVFWQEQIATERESFTELELDDGTSLSMGPEAKVTLDSFVYNQPGAANRLVLNVSRGMMRFVTGQMEKSAYEIRAPGAIIGVRGTAFTLIVDPETAVTTCFVHHGAVEIRDVDGAGSVVVTPGQMSVVRSNVTEPPWPAQAPSPEVLQAILHLDAMLSKGRVNAAQTRQALAPPPVGMERRVPESTKQAAGGGVNRDDRRSGIAGSSGAGSSGYDSSNRQPAQDKLLSTPEPAAAQPQQASPSRL
jgi:ferric-dicitrate binding protein FerR (iron transport regulator)